MKIKVYGPGCARCTQTEALVKAVVAAKGDGIEVEKVSDLKEMMSLGIISTPAIAIDGVIKCTGRIPTREEVAAWIDNTPQTECSSAASQSGCGCKH